MNNTVAHLLANIYDNGRFDTDTKHSFPVPSQHRFVIEATSTDEIPKVLLARCSIINVSSQWPIPRDESRSSQDQGQEGGGGGSGGGSVAGSWRQLAGAGRSSWRKNDLLILMMCDKLVGAAASVMVIDR